jgi:copper oxidase (laccase) domain-containing protein
VRAGLDAMVGLGADPATTRVHLGPAACGDCYEVGPEVVELLELACASPDRSWRNERPDGTVAVDLRRHLHQQLVDAGVGTQAISQSTRCTIEDQHLYSHRRDGADRPTGRHGVVVVRSA